MKKVFKLIGKIALWVLSSIVSLVILVLVVLNIAKFAIYGEYYSIEETVCANPGLYDGFVCQGIAASEENNVILISGYMQGDAASRIYVTNAANISYYVQLKQGNENFTGHVGGIATTGNTVYIADGDRIHTLPLNLVLSAKNGDFVDVGDGTVVANKASFVYTDDNYLYVGEFHDGGAYVVEGHEVETAEGTHYAYCTKYALNDLKTPLKVYSIRNKVQGICFTPDGQVIMSTSYGLTDTVYYVYNESEAVATELTHEGAPIVCLDKLQREVKGPAMGEDLDYYNGKVITMTESASNKYIFGKLFFAYDIVALDFKKLDK